MFFFCHRLRNWLSRSGLSSARVVAKVSLFSILGFTATGAWAIQSPGDLGTLGVPGVTSIGNAVGVGAFSDSYTFQVASSASFVSQVVSVTLSNIVDVNGLWASLWDAGNNMLTHATATTVSVGSHISVAFAGLAYSPLDPLSTYELRIGGNAVGAWGGWYAGTISLASYSTNIAPVPEPEIYAMMAAGLGIVGWSARRKRRKPIWPA